MPQISIIIPTKNEEKNLGRLLKEIKNQDWYNNKDKIDYEVIIADANSDDNTKGIAEKFDVKKIVAGGLPSKGRNNGVKFSRGKIIFVIDADVSIKNKKFFINAYNEFLEKGLDCATVDNKPIISNDTFFIKRYFIDIIFDIENYFIRIVKKSKNPRAIGTCMIFKRESFLDVKGFNENIYFGEDSEIAKRLVNMGYCFDVLNSKFFIETSIRRISKKGVIKYAKDALILDFYRRFVGEIYSKDTYFKLTGTKNHFEK